MNRLSRSLSFLVLFGLVSVSAGQHLANKDRPPNVIIILTDDQGWQDAGCYGSEDIQTPGIDRLASEGVLLTQFYAAAPVCSPSRAGLLTGRYPVRAGVPGNVSSQQGHAGMPTAQVTIAETLRAAGYATAHVGKWHLGYTPETMPNGQGFDVSFGHMGGCIDNYSHFFYWNGPNRHDLWKNGREIHQPGTFFPDLMVQQAGDFMANHRDQPFFLYFAMNTPHYPYQGDVNWLEKYANLPYPRNLYAAFVSTLDQRIGQLIDAVDQLGLRDQTIVIFQSDHGQSYEERAHFGGGSSGPYRGGKFSLFEGGIRVPAIIRWPTKLPRGVTRNQVAHSCDWLPTIAALCDLPLVEPDIDGLEITQLLKSADAASPHEVLHWTHGRSWAVRQGDWKLIAQANDPSQRTPLTSGDRRRFLVNLAEDPGELHNVASQHPSITRRLEQFHAQWTANQ